ncbi:MAG: 4-alpha-glucanotransferase [Alphaproteobacteria bacterium]
MSEREQLRCLARLYGVQPSYYDMFGRLNEPPPEALLDVLRMLGAAVEKMADLGGALRERRQFLAQQMMKPVVVLWDGKPGNLELRVPQRLAEAPVKCAVVLENGENVARALADDPGWKLTQRAVEGTTYVRRRVQFPSALPTGYHRMRLQVGGRSTEHYLFAAPLRAFGADKTGKRSWGLFCPLYALHSKNSWGVGDFTDLRSLLDLVKELGGDVVGTLPLFSTFLDEPFNPSPYAPVSRLYWNELFLDVDRIAELKRCVAARAIIHSPAFEADLEQLRAAPWVDYRRAMALKREVLNELLRCLLRQRSGRRSEFERFMATHPEAQDYAAFRAKTDGERKPWQQWDGPSREGDLRPGDYVEHIKHYHLFVQWLADKQMRGLGESTEAGGPGVYLDFPLGVNRDGYDVWRKRDVFALGANGGAPPDNFFIKGQNWGFPPLHPEGLRRQGYRYYIDCVRHHLEHAKMLRIDHVMGLYRLYWVPDGFAPTEGVYVRYPAEEFFAVLNLESHRYQARIVGENLGTVPPAVNAAMGKHNILGMYVSQFGVTWDPNRALDPAPAGAVVSLNTHDTPTFAGFWAGADIDDRVALGLLTDDQARDERQGRERQRGALSAYLKSLGLLNDEAPGAAAVLRAWLLYLAGGNAEFLLVNLEDLWLELSPQNVPGTWEERPNWKRKTRYAFEQIHEQARVHETLRAIHQLRRKGSENKT